MGASILPDILRDEGGDVGMAENTLRRNYPMRCVQNARFGCIFNPWSDGGRAFRNEF